MKWKAQTRRSNLNNDIEILTRTSRPKLLLLPETDSNSKTSKVDIKQLYSNISNTRLYKLTQTLK